LNQSATSPRSSERSPDHPAEVQSRIARERNRKIIRVGRIINGYLVTEGSQADGYCYTDRADVHRHLDRFFDQLEVSSEASADASSGGE
jgi:hypothetical protein